MARPPVVTVILPTYNRCRALPGVVESVCGQSYPYWHLCISDDASTDATSQVGHQLVDTLHRSIVYGRNAMNLGEYRNVNQALAMHFSTRYVAVLQDDSRYVDPDFLAIAVQELEKSPSLSFVAGKVQGEEDMWKENLRLMGRGCPGNLGAAAAF